MRLVSSSPGGGSERKVFPMRKITLTLIFLMVGSLLLASCAKPGPGNNGQPPVETGGSGQPEPGTQETKAEEPSVTGSRAADSYTAYLDAKSELIARLSDAVTENPDAGMAMMSFLGISLIDLAMWPAAFLGQDETAAKVGMGYLGIEDVKFDRDGSRSSITFKDDEGKETVFTGDYDEKGDGYRFTAREEGEEKLYSEYRRTSYGFVGQYYISNDDGTVNYYMLTIEGKDGTVGFSSEVGRPSPLTGQEPVDFPKSAPEWYSVKGNTVTGVTSEGEELNFEIP